MRAQAFVAEWNRWLCKIQALEGYPSGYKPVQAIGYSSKWGLLEDEQTFYNDAVWAAFLPPPGLMMHQ